MYNKTDGSEFAEVILLNGAGLQSMMKIEYFIEKEREGQYFTIPFDVPGNVIKITVSYDYNRPTKGVLSDLKPSNCIDIGLSDETGKFLGWSGSAHSEISVGEFTSSDGYLTQKIRPGRWGILAGAYHVQDKGVSVTYNIRFEFAGERLFFGDLHIHTRASDGVFDASEIGGLAKKSGLDFVALANHNNYAENLHLPSVNGVTFIPAVEWTHYNGHMNFFGVPAPFGDSFIANSKEEMDAVISHARSLGAVISVNHPRCSFCPYLWGDDDAFDMVEIWNGPMRPTNIRGIDYWTALLKTGRKLPAVGGSDFHKPGFPVKFANPVTGVYAPDQSAGSLLGSIRQGHCFVSESVYGPRILLKYGGSRMGDTAAYDSGTGLEVDVRSDYPVKTVLVTDRGEREIKDNAVKIEKTKFAYVKVYRKNGKKIRAVSNPIYFEQEEK